MRLTNSVIEQIYRHAVQEYPYECCGLVTGDANDQTVHPCQNIQNRLHAEDPERYPRDAQTAYTMNRDEVERISTEAEKQGNEVLAFYHSHIDCDAYFSQTDRDAQTVFGEPEFPDALQLIISVKGGVISGLKCYRWSSEHEEYTAVQLS